MKIALYSTHILWPTHHETDLEIMQSLLDEGCEITNMSCNGSLRSCEILNEAVFQQQNTNYKQQQQSNC
ncbi:MAG: hypothetical protein NTZ59_15305, partial [Bacteroidetes bacterium]|nr:hypothetical protein [Bacteroidota bacterium]